VACDRVKELSADTARRALRRSVHNNSTVEPCSHRSASPSSPPRPSPAPAPSPSPRVDADIRRKLLASRHPGDADVNRCSLASGDTLRRRHDCDDRLAQPAAACVRGGDGAWFLPIADTRSPRCRRLAASSALDDIDELMDETVVDCRHESQLSLQPPLPPFVAWASDDDAAAETEERGAGETGNWMPVQTPLTASAVDRHQSRRTPNSDPAVSLDHRRPIPVAIRSQHGSPVASGVQSDFVLSSTARPPTTTPSPREAVGKLRAEGDRSTNVDDRRHKLGESVDRAGDDSQIQTSDKVPSKVLDVVPIGDAPCLPANVTCCRVQNGTSGCSKEVTCPANDKCDTTASRIQTMQGIIESLSALTTKKSGNNRQQVQTQAATQKECKASERNKQVEKEQPEVEVEISATNNSKSGRCKSSPTDTAKLLGELIGKISELATRHDQLEFTAPGCRGKLKDKGSQTEDLNGEKSAASKTQQQKHGERLIKEKRCCSNRRREPQTQRQSTTNNDDPASKLSLQAGDDSKPTKLADSSRTVNDNSGQQNSGCALTDNVIHIVRGSSQLEELTVEELVSYFSETCRLLSDRAPHSAAQTTQDQETTQSAMRMSPLPHDDGPASPVQVDRPPQQQDTLRQDNGIGSAHLQRTTHDVSPRPSRETRQQVASASPTRSTRPHDEQHLHATQLANKTSTEAREQTRRDSVNISRDHARLKTQYVLCRVVSRLVFCSIASVDIQGGPQKVSN